MSKTFETLVEQLERIPSIGKKSAFKIAYTLVMEDKILALSIAHCIENSVQYVRQCEICGGISEEAICDICGDEERRSNGKLCIVTSPKDIITIEQTHTFEGTYLVIKDTRTMDYDKIITRIQAHNIQEIIFAFIPSLASDIMMTYIEDKLSHTHIRFSKIAQGVPTGVGLDNVDTLSLKSAFKDRVKI